MTRDELISMAQEAGMSVQPGRDGPWDITATEHSIERFADLVAAAERTACAQVCEQFEEDMGYGIPQRCAEAIRARGEK